MGLKGEYTSKLLLGLEKRLKTKVCTCIKKITKMRLMRYRIMKKNGFLTFLGKEGLGWPI